MTPITDQEHTQLPAPQEGTMRAIIQRRYGSADVLELGEVDKPPVGHGDVLVRVHASSVNPADWHDITGKPYVMRLMTGLSKPKKTIPGRDMAGRVEAVGPGVTSFHPGDEVFAEISGGCYAEYVCVPEAGLGTKPANLSFEEAAAVPIAAITALQGLRDQGKVTAGQKVLINGASGGVGTFAVQIAKALGAEVTGVCSTRNVEMVASIGADHVVDYTSQDFTRAGEQYDVVLDLVGNRSWRDCRRALGREAVYILCTDRPGGNWLGPLPWMAGRILSLVFASQKAKSFVANQTPQDLAVLTELIESGKVTPVIDRRFTLAEVTDAVRHQDAGHAQGKSVITI
jgi:NADPH:quinone reductase-like Zn-dependent oxidoreductase